MRLILWLHLLAAIAWIGPSIGAWWVYRHAARAGYAQQAIRWFEKVMVAEHVALLVLGGTGLVLVSGYGWWPLPAWLVWKLGLVALVVVPIEGIDLLLAHFWLPKHRDDAGLKIFDRWLWGAGVPLMLAIACILMLAVVRPV